MLWVFLSVAVFSSMFFRSPLASALAQKMRADGAADPGMRDAVAQLTDEVHALREDLMEIAERVDFTERALADVRRLSPLPEGRGSL